MSHNHNQNQQQHFHNPHHYISPQLSHAHLDSFTSTSSPSTPTPSPPHPSWAQPYRSNMSQRDGNSSGGAGNSGNNNSSQSRQPTSYPSPHSYPSPSAAGGYQYPPPSHTANIEPYRASPTASNAQLPSLNLPPIRIMDQQHQTPQQQVAQLQQQSAQAQMGSPLPPPVAPMGGSYYNPNLPPQQGNPNITSSPLNQSIRYPLPTDGRIMSGGRHKKEIKRRTKTGCLTCRKRRIKCDEAHPVCRNCTKSKRECLGYDPIFKAQQTGPTNIQPAPSAGSPMSSIQSGSGNQGGQFSNNQGYMPTGAAPYAPALSTGNSSPGSSVEPYDPTFALDPALAGADSTQIPIPTSTFEGATSYRPDLKAALESGSPYSSTTSEAPNARAKSIKMDELLSHEGAFPSPQPPTTDGKTPIPSDTINELKSVYLKAYAPFIDSFLETTWYTTAGVRHLVQNQLLCEQLHMILRFFTHGDPSDPDIHSHETRLIWELMKMCYAAPGVDVKGFSNGSISATGEELDVEAFGVAKRLKVFEQLICGQRAETNILDSFGAYSDDVFWKALGHFITLPDHDGDSLQESERTLGSMRQTLNVQENRDVLYSVAVIRHFKDRHVPSSFAPTNDEDDPRNRLRVANMFINNEASGKSSNEVVTRLCSLILKCQAAQTGKLKAAT